MPSKKSLSTLLTPNSVNHTQHPSLKCQFYNLEINPLENQAYLEYASNSLREAYVDNDYLSSVLAREGFEGVTKLFSERFPPASNEFGVRSGDFGEVIAHMVLQDVFGHTIPVMKLRYKTNWEKAAFGVDVVAFHLHESDPSQDTVVFSEVKASKQKDYGIDKVFEEISLLVEEGQPESKQKMRNAVRFVSERLFGEKQFELEKRIYRFLDCYTNPKYVESFFPFLVRDKATWNNDALSGKTFQKPEPDKVILCVFLLDNFEDTMNACYLKAIQWQQN